MGSLQVSIDICIATYKRPRLLRKLLTSLINQETRGQFTYCIIVVDNDACRSAEGVVAEFKGNDLAVIYDVEPEQNISLARNRSLRHATGDLIATIDDDEWADACWLLNLYTAMVSHKADAVHGPVIAILPAKTPSCVRKSAVFNRPNLPTGSTEHYTCYTANSLFRRKLIGAIDKPFDPDFGRTGGEDLVFFKKLKMQGHMLIWCEDAAVFTSVPPERANFLWVLRRFFRNGGISYRMYHDSLARAFRAAALLKIGAFMRIAFLCSMVLLCLLGSVCNRQFGAKAVKILERIAFQVGFIASFLNFRYEEYRPK